MIDIGKILKRAWHILWNFRVLWIFGILLAITAGGNGGSNGSSGSSGYRFNGNNGYRGVIPSTNPTVQQLNNWFQQNIEPLVIHPDQHIATFVWISVAIFLFVLIVGLLFALVRYPSETAVIRMVDEYEQTGIKTGFRAGWKLGWNRRAFRIWVIDLVGQLAGIPAAGGAAEPGFAGLFSASGTARVRLSPPVLLPQSDAHSCSSLPSSCLMVVLGLLRQFFVRAAALEETRIGESFRRGWVMFIGNWKSAGLMWLVMLGIGIGFGIGGLVLFFLLIPAYIVLVIPAVIAAAIPGDGGLRDHQYFRKRTPGMDPGYPGCPAVLLPDRVRSTDLDQRLVQDLRIQRLDADLP